ncbi:MAG: hypothetical protein RQ732_07500 [Methylophaga sp.]|nr:hypothetical protein [Methylophaga sp.]
MLKQTISIILSAMLLVMGTAIADHHKSNEKDTHKGMKHPAHEMGEVADIDRTEQHSKKYKENLEQAKDTKHDAHPAHKMGSENTHVGTKHPAHKMGESEEALRERGQ